MFPICCKTLMGLIKLRCDVLSGTAQEYFCLQNMFYIFQYNVLLKTFPPIYTHFVIVLNA
jgi:hypothetical protein